MTKSQSHPHALPAPPAAAEHDDSFEMLRVWAAGGGQHVTLMPMPDGDPAIWGVFLADLVRHVANATAMSQELAVDDVLRRIKEGFDAEWADPTDWAEGRLRYEEDESV